MWKAAVDCLSVLDVLIAMSYYSRHGDVGNMCRPDFIWPNTQTQVVLVVVVVRAVVVVVVVAADPNPRHN